MSAADAAMRNLALAAVADEGLQLAVAADHPRQALPAQQDAGTRLAQQLVLTGVQSLKGAREEVQPAADRLRDRPDQAFADALDKACGGCVTLSTRRVSAESAGSHVPQFRIQHEALHPATCPGAHLSNGVAW